MNDEYFKKIKVFLDFLQKEKNYSNNTIIAYKTDILEFFSFLKEQKVLFENIDIKIVRKFLDILYKRNTKPSSISRKISSLKSFVKFLINHKFLPQEKNPFLYIRNREKQRKALVLAVIGIIICCVSFFIYQKY